LKKRQKHDRGAYLNATALEAGFGKKIINLIPKNSRIIAAISGGPDSTALLYLLNKYAREYNYEITACHFNHKLRGKSSDKDEIFCRRLCAAKGIEFVSASADVKKLAREQGKGTEAAAREARYVFFIKEAARRKAAYIVLGHNMDDAAETYMMRVINGAGLSGLSGICEKRQLGRDEFKGCSKGRQISLVRPMLWVLKKDITNYLEIKGQKFVTDKSNHKNIYERNRIRNILIPFIENNFNPSFRKTCGAQGMLLSSDADFMEKQADDFFEKKVSVSQNIVRINRELLLGLHPAIRGRVLRRALLMFFGERKAGNSLVKLTEAAAFSGKKTDLGSGILSETAAKEMVLRKVTHKAATESIGLKIDNKKHLFNGMAIKAKSVIKTKMPVFDDKNTAYLDAEKVKLPLTVRQRAPGDRFMPFGMKNIIKLKDFIIGQKAGTLSLPVVADAEKIVWVAGLRVDERVKVMPNTRKMLVIKAFFETLKLT